MSNWSNDKLKQREQREIKTGGFGYGSPMEPILCLSNGANPFQLTQPEQLNELDEMDNTQRCKQELIAEATNMATNFINFVTKLSQAPEDIFEDMKLRSAIQTTNRLIGCNIAPRLRNYNSDCSQPNISQVDDPFWNRPDVIQYLIELERALTKRHEYVEMEFVAPSFDLGYPKTPQTTVEVDEQKKKEGEQESEMQNKEQSMQTNEQHQEEDRAVEEDSEMNLDNIVTNISFEILKEKFVQKEKKQEGKHGKGDENIQEGNQEADTEGKLQLPDKKKAKMEQKDRQKRKMDKDKTNQKTSLVEMAKKQSKKLLETMPTPHLIKEVDPDEMITTDESTLAYFALHNTKKSM